MASVCTEIVKWIKIVHCIEIVQYIEEYSIALIMHTLVLSFVLFWFYYQLLIHMSNSPIFSRVTSLALGQSYDCPSASEAILKDMGKVTYITPQQDITKLYQLCT